jgi:Primase C terminal 1 (PriCT-1)
VGPFETVERAQHSWQSGACHLTTESIAIPRITVPDDLAELDQWLLWRYEARQGKPTKVPFTADGRRASSTNPANWTGFEAALKCWSRFPKHYAGIGFVFSKADPFVGLDLDDCLDPDGNCKDWARGTVERFADTYMEISPSGTGVKIWARGSLPANLPGVKVGDGQIEIYDHSRYFAVTSRAFRGAPLDVEDHASDMAMLYQWLTQSNGTRRWPLQPIKGGRIPHGQQHSTLVSILGTLRARRICDDAIEACLQIINEKQCEKPGPPENISRMVRSSGNWRTA